MTITAAAVLQVAQIAVLIAIFFRLGSHGAQIESVKDRVIKLEKKSNG